MPGLTVEELPTPDVGSKFDLTMYAVEQKDGMTLELLYNTDLFAADRIVEMLRQFQFLLTQIVERPDEKIGNYSLVTPTGKQLLPDPHQALPGTSRPPIHTLFSEQARRNPNHVAVLEPNESWTYGDLDCRTNQLANRLIVSGIQKGDTVAIYGHRSAPLVLAVMSVLKAGAAFVILDPAYPVARLISLLEVAKPRAWLQITAAGPLPNRLDEYVETLACCCRLELSAGASAETLLSDYSTTDPQLRVDSDDLACVAFTSGSTGTPKGILGRHGALTHYAPWVQDLFGVDQTDRFSMLSGLSHDPLQRDIFTPLQLGATICIPDPEDLADPPKLVAWFNEQKITVANLTPAMAQVLTDRTWTRSPSQIPSLRYTFIVGEVLTKRDVSRLKALAPSMTCVNLYGATETQRALSYFIVPPTPAQSFAAEGQRPGEKEVLPLGRGMPEVQLLLLNSAQQMSGIGEVGEIYFRSPHLAKGFLGDDALTRERFLLNPFTKAPGDRLYRSGDLGRYMPDGNIEFLGRVDRQVKVRGFRIELGEVEAAVTAHPKVRESVVLLRERDSSEKYLAAYVVPVRESAITTTELRRYLKDKLPDYMLPSDCLMMEAMPLTPNGKVDRAALPVPDHSRSEAEKDFVAPRNDTEERLASIWAEVLKVDRVGINDNFFELGGHSLLATQAVGRIRNAFQIDLPLRALFESPTLKELGERLHERTAPAGNGRFTSAITPVAHTSEFPLSFAQQRLWFLNELDGESAFYNLTWAVRLHGELDVHALREAIRTIVNRHETLRTTFSVVDGQPIQVISDSTDVAFSITDLRDVPDVLLEDEAKRWRITEARQPFDLQTGPLFRARLLKLRTDDHLLSINWHHIVSDGWSVGVFVRELAELYESFVTGRPHRLPDLPVQYAEYAVWQREWIQGEVLGKQLAYWKQQLSGAPAVLDLPKDRPRPAVQTFRGGMKSTQLSPELSNA
ncbi:MAG TPA: amino acid adenylation domain-containing protein, partial [Pyrinomonadaceae bacterium]|nr:amino acid adenylation domain-containing protein [Pyrinomonadaceae bacterium]